MSYFLEEVGICRTPHYMLHLFEGIRHMSDCLNTLLFLRGELGTSQSFSFIMMLHLNHLGFLHMLKTLVFLFGFKSCQKDF
jgi:hypothetical protein